MNTLSEIEAAAEALPAEEQKELLLFLAARLRIFPNDSQGARVVRRENDVLLQAPAGALPMTPENVRRILDDWP